MQLSVYSPIICFWIKLSTETPYLGNVANTAGKPAAPAVFFCPSDFQFPQVLKRKKAPRLGGKCDHARTGPGTPGLLRGQQRYDLAQLCPDLANGGSHVIGTSGTLRRKRRRFRRRGLGPPLGGSLGGGCLLGTPVAFERIPCPRDRVAFPMHQPFDFQREFHFAAAVKALPGAALIRLELGKLRLPEAKDVWLDAAEARNVADLEIQPIGDDGRVDHALSRLCRHIHHAIAIPEQFNFRACS